MRWLFVVALMVTTTGCATPSQRVEPVDPQARLSMLQLMQQLSETQEAYAKMAEAKQSVMVALQALEGVKVEINQIPYTASDVERWCPSVARSLAAGETSAISPHQRRLAAALLALDDELVASGHGSAGCRVDPTSR
ncbi:MAG: hypothetical protein RIF41_24260 [Polyangiaceae bacterium]